MLAALLGSVFFIGGVLPAYAANHAPIVSWIEDQVLVDNNSELEVLYFSIVDPDGETFAVGDIEPPIVQNRWNDNLTFYSEGKVLIESCDEVGCPPGAGYKLTLDDPDGYGAATITLKVTDSGDAEGSSAFAIRRQPNSTNPPIVAGIPSTTVNLNGAGYGPVQFVVDDLNSQGLNDMEDGGIPALDGLTAISDNHDVVKDADIDILPTSSPRTFTLKVIPTGGNSGRAAITVTAKDKEGYFTDTAFVVNVLNNGSAPMFDRDDAEVSGSFVERTDTNPNHFTVYKFKVSDQETTNPANLAISAVSSNPGLVPNDPANLQLVAPANGGYWLLKIKPVLPLTGIKAPLASTITLTVTDVPPTGSFKTSYNDRLQFLFVMRDESSTIPTFLRPTGIYNLDPKVEEDHHDESFVTGEMRRLSWREIEQSAGEYHWGSLTEIFDHLPADLSLSLNLKEEPCYIAEGLNSDETWCDTTANQQDWGCASSINCGDNGTLRAVPWNETLLDSREAFLSALKTQLTTEQLARIEIINCNLPGGDSGIRNLLGQPFTGDPSQPPGFTYLPGYTRENFLAAVQHELRTVQDTFPGKLVQIGFFRVEDDQNGNYPNNDPLWRWLYPYLASEFNGIKRPRVSFFQEDLAASRPSAVADFISYTDVLPYTLFPDITQLPSFAYYCGGEECDAPAAAYNNGIVYQANTVWSAPLSEFNKTTKTLNGTPNDALEGAFNDYFNHYLEIYPSDLAHADENAVSPPADWQKWQDGFKSWKEYTDHLRHDVLQLEAPAGLTVERTDSTHNKVKWYAVYSPDGIPVFYHVQRKNGTSWSDVCSSTSDTECEETSSSNTEYFYKVWASNGQNPDSPAAYVALFFSQPGNDGYVTRLGATKTAWPSDSTIGVRAGEGYSVVQGQFLHERGFLSFNTTGLAGASILTAEFRLKQKTDGSYFNALGDCKVDIQKGRFSNNAALQGSDYDFPANLNTTVDAFRVTDVGADSVLDLDLSLLMDKLSNNDFTQMRIWFAEQTIQQNQYEGWYSGESAGSEPQLVIQYQP